MASSLTIPLIFAASALLGYGIARTVKGHWAEFMAIMQSQAPEMRTD